MILLPQIIFLLALCITGYLATKNILRIKRNIQLGKPFDIKGDSKQRLKNMLLIAFGQKKMFDRPVVGFMHLIIYLGFVIINLEVLEILLDGLLEHIAYCIPY